MEAHWYVVQTKPRQEDKAAENLQNQGFEVFLPYVRTRKKQRAKWTSILEPLFRSYLFLNIDPSADSVAPVRSTVGVNKLVRFGEQLLPVPDKVIQFLQTNQQELIAEQSPVSQFTSGQTLEITHGPFKGLGCVFDMPHSLDRIVVLMDLLGKQTKVTLNVHHVASST